MVTLRQWFATWLDSIRRRGQPRDDSLEPPDYTLGSFGNPPDIDPDPGPIVPDRKPRRTLKRRNIPKGPRTD